MMKTFSIGNTAKTLKLKEEFQGGNYGDYGQKKIRLEFNQDDFFVGIGKYVRSASKSYTAVSGDVTEGTGVEALIVNMRFVTAVDFDLRVGQIVDLASTETGKARILSISNDRKVLKLMKVEDFALDLGLSTSIVLPASGKFMDGDNLELVIDNIENLSIVNTNGSPTANNLTMILLTNEVNI